jgi:hypothetical protein
VIIEGFEVQSLHVTLMLACYFVFNSSFIYIFNYTFSYLMLTVFIFIGVLFLDVYVYNKSNG